MLIDTLRKLFHGQPVNFMSAMMQILAVLFVIFCILPLHEYAHGWMARKLGDDTAERDGRLTMNPLASVDPAGSLFLLLFGFGWAKPVPIDPRNFKHPKRDMALTALAGPVANLLAGWVGVIVYYIIQLGFFRETGMPGWLAQFLVAYISINASLAAFNLVPLPPLDGSKILGAFLSDRALASYYRYQNIIVMVAFVVLFTGMLGRPLAIFQNSLLNFVIWLGELPFRLFGVL